MTFEEDEITAKQFDTEYPELKNMIYVGGSVIRTKAKIYKHCLSRQRVKEAIEKVKSKANFSYDASDNLIIYVIELLKELRID